MATRRKASSAWPFGRKFALWLADRGLSLNAFAKRNGFSQSTLQGWAKRGVRVPADALTRISAATRLPVGYWLDDAVGYPPPIEYEALGERLTQALSAVPGDELRDLLAIVENAEDRRRVLAVWRLWRTGGSPPPPPRSQAAP